MSGHTGRRLTVAVARAVGHGVVGSASGHAAAGGDRCEAAGPVPADWLRLARTARMLSWLTLSWMGVEGGVAIAAGMIAGSVALLGFGLDSGIEAMASVIVIWRFTGTRLASPASERRAQRLVAASFFLLAPYIAVEAVGALAAGDRAETSVAGLVLTAGAAVFEPALGVAKRRIGARLGSAATAGEGTQNLLCAYLAMAVFAGLAANTLFGAWWLDGVVALGIAGWAVIEGRKAWAGRSCGCASQPGLPCCPDTVISRYSGLARTALAGGTITDCDPGAFTDSGFGAAAYAGTEEAPEAALWASLGCGNPLTVASLQPGETVLDLGSGGGLDVLLSARRVAPGGTAYGLDASPDMLVLARANAAAAGVTNARFLHGHIEDIPLPSEHVDVVISNCVINLSTDKPGVLAEAFRVLRPGGRLGISDVIADEGFDPTQLTDAERQVGCVNGTLTQRQYAELLEAAGFTAITITPTHGAGPGLHSAIIQAAKPATQNP